MRGRRISRLLLIAAAAWGAASASLAPRDHPVHLLLIVFESRPAPAASEGLRGPVDRTDAPFRICVPIADHSGLADTDKLLLAGSDVAQYRILERWPGGNIKWIEVHGRADVSGGTPNTRLMLTAGASNETDNRVARPDGRGVLVDTGAMALRVSPGGNELMRARVAGSEREAVWELDVRDPDGRRLESMTPPRVVVEDNGPLMTVVRIEGALKVGEGRVLGYDARVTCHVRRTSVALELTLRNDRGGDSQDVSIGSAALLVAPGSGAADLRRGAAGGEARPATWVLASAGDSRFLAVSGPGAGPIESDDGAVMTLRLSSAPESGLAAGSHRTTTHFFDAATSRDPADAAHAFLFPLVARSRDGYGYAASGALDHAVQTAAATRLYHGSAGIRFHDQPDVVPATGASALLHELYDHLRACDDVRTGAWYRARRVADALLGDWRYPTADDDVGRVPGDRYVERAEHLDGLRLWALLSGDSRTRDALDAVDVARGSLGSPAGHPDELVHRRNEAGLWSRQDRDRGFLAGSTVPAAAGYGRLALAALRDAGIDSESPNEAGLDRAEGVALFAAEELWWGSDEAGGFLAQLDPGGKRPSDPRGSDAWTDGLEPGAGGALVAAYRLTGAPRFLRRSERLLAAAGRRFGVVAPLQGGLERHDVLYLLQNLRRIPVWRDLRVDVEDVRGGYRLGYEAPPGAVAIRVKYATRPVVPWLGFDPERGKWKEAPAGAVPFFAATNLKGEPAPPAPGSFQVLEIRTAREGLHFAARCLEFPPALRKPRRPGPRSVTINLTSPVDAPTMEAPSDPVGRDWAMPALLIVLAAGVVYVMLRQWRRGSSG